MTIQSIIAEEILFLSSLGSYYSVKEPINNHTVEMFDCFQELDKADVYCVKKKHRFVTNHKGVYVGEQIFVHYHKAKVYADQNNGTVYKLDISKKIFDEFFKAATTDDTQGNIIKILTRASNLAPHRIALNPEYE